MTREEIDNLFVDFDEMGFCPTTLCEDAEKYAIQWRNDMRNAIVNHETDLLKEFVEWLKKRLDEQSTRLKKGDEFDLERSIGIYIVLVNLDNHLVKFLETKDERQSP